MKKIATLAVLATLACAASAFADPSGTVMMYSSMQEKQLVAIREGFEKKYPGIKMEYYFAGTGKVMTKIATEAQAGHVDADVLWVGDPTNYVQFKAQGILEQYVSPETEFIDKAFVDPEGYYTGARMMNMGIAYNTQNVKGDDIPKTWNDLLSSKWKDALVMTDPNTAGTTKYWRNAMMANPKYGVTFFEGLKANGCKMASGTTATHNEIAAGEYDVGVCLDYVTENIKEKGSPIEFVYPEETVSIFSPIGLVKNAKNMENGKLLYDFILSKEGQEIIVAQNLLSVRAGIQQKADVAAIAAKAMASDMKDVVEKEAESKAAFDKIFR